MRYARVTALAGATAAAVIVGLLAPTTAATGAPTSRGDGLNPGQFVQYRQKVPVNVVLVGYDDDVVRGLSKVLPASSTPLVRYPQFYGLQGRNLGLSFDYSYKFIDAPASFENSVFSKFASIATTSGPTVFQQAYNDQLNNVRDVTGPVLNIDAPSAEKILEQTAATQLGINGRTSYTVFLVNWFGRKDFKFHVFRKTDEPDPDTGVNFGATRSSRAMIAWGGTTGRSWFYDLSAGPEAWGNNWNVDDADLDGNGVPDYRIPPIWEYGKGAYRSVSKLGGDLGKVVRYIALNLLFTSSPLYDPLVTAPAAGGKTKVVVNLFDDDPAVSGADWVQTSSSRSEWAQLEPFHDITASLNQRGPSDPETAIAFDNWAGTASTPGCWDSFGTSEAALFCSLDARRSLFLPASGKNYIEGVYVWNTTDEKMAGQNGLLGFADDNWVDGTQSYVFAFEYPSVLDAGYGITTTLTHEVGHHLGLSHPHDGYDPTTGVDYGPSDEFQYVWGGDESDTIMQYIAVSNGFGTFDRDNMARYFFAGYLNWANAVAGALQGTALTGAERAKLASADSLAAQARGEFRSWSYAAAAGHARQAWLLVRGVADAHGIAPTLRPSLLKANPGARVVKDGNRIRFPKDKPVVVR
jgi:hypothetical protein